ncbi:hypothetical protein SARC_00468 [Sphaeroforma arctica JP610]|uniref:Calcineurin-like phosphoesterase domain-containing protein n=1 Tax=Sphaeroforma arctica JP610 TaxID=667725 RepID=A0A0L0GEY8_9EUKA|nr:hypothetical protein SARC_00468 [Sphaeroforma arctica JP610]KNC87431.1 hypothetical protein SARC_00468 [Sphaeroforma arctica JP610]|eukprot:XP_014161333.1 hypothetical protein SARC_00468 [Sphaeroforma arctica JP610]
MRLTARDDAEPTLKFENFVNNTVPVINPSVVLCTGDITRGYGNSTGLFDLQGEQNKQEWQLYKLVCATVVILYVCIET